MISLEFLKLLLYHTLGTFDNLLYGCLHRIYNSNLESFGLDQTDRKFLFARNGFLLILVKKLLCGNPRYFYLRKPLLHWSLSVKEWTSKLHSSFDVRNIVLRDWTYVLDLSNLLRQLVSTFGDVIKVLYDADGIDTERLDREVACILERFLSMFQEQGIPLIDIFAVFNTFREGFYLYHDGRYFCIKFGSKHGIKVGRKKCVITLDSSSFYLTLRGIMKRLESNPVQHDLLSFMYCTILRNPNFKVAPGISFPFALTISQNYQVWLSFLNWETERSKFLERMLCKFVFYPSFSRKGVTYYHSSRNTNYTSYRAFFQNNYHIAERYSGSEEISLEPI